MRQEDRKNIWCFYNKPQYFGGSYEGKHPICLDVKFPVPTFLEQSREILEGRFRRYNGVTLGGWWAVLLSDEEREIVLRIFNETTFQGE